MRKTVNVVGILSFLSVSLFFLLEFVIRVEPGLAPQQIASYFNLSNSGLGTLSSVFFWVYAPMQIVVGLLLDRYGARKTVLPAILLCVGGLLLFTATSSIVSASLGRALQGFGGAFAFVAALYVAAQQFPPERFAILSGIVNAIGGIGTAIGTVALVNLIAISSWQSVFYATAIFGVGLFVLAFLFVRDTKDPDAKAGPTPGIGEVLAPVKELATSPHVWIISIVSALTYLPISVYAGLWGPAEMQADHGLSKETATAAIAAFFWGQTIGSLLIGALSDWFNMRKYLLFWHTIAAGVALTAAIFLPGIGAASAAVLLFISGYFCAAQVLTYPMAKEGVSAKATGTVLAFVNMISISGAILFQPLVGYLVDAAGGDFTYANYVYPITLALAALLTLVIKEDRHSDHLS